MTLTACASCGKRFNWNQLLDCPKCGARRPLGSDVDLSTFKGKREEKKLERKFKKELKFKQGDSVKPSTDVGTDIFLGFFFLSIGSFIALWPARTWDLKSGSIFLLIFTIISFLVIFFAGFIFGEALMTHPRGTTVKKIVYVLRAILLIAGLLIFQFGLPNFDDSIGNVVYEKIISFTLLVPMGRPWTILRRIFPKRNSKSLGGDSEYKGTSGVEGFLLRATMLVGSWIFGIIVFGVMGFVIFNVIRILLMLFGLIDLSSSNDPNLFTCTKPFFLSPTMYCR